MGGLRCLRLRSILMKHLKCIMIWMLEFLIRGWEWEGDMVMARFTELVRCRTIFSTSLPNPSLTSVLIFR